MNITSQIKLCPRGAHTYAQPLFRCCDLDNSPMTLKLEDDLDILNMYLHTENEVARLRHSKLLIEDDMCMANEKYEYSPQDQGQMSPVLAFTMRHIVLSSYISFRPVVSEILCGQTHTQTPPKQYCSQHSWRAGKNYNLTAMWSERL